MAFAVQAAQIKNVRLADYQPGVARLVIELDSNTEYNVFTLDGPNRIVADFFKTSFAASAPKSVKAVGVVKNVRFGHREKDISRVVLEMPDKNFKFYQFILKPEKNENWRVVVDITHSKAETNPKSDVSPQKNKPKKSTKPIAVSEPNPIPAPIPEPPKKKRIPLIVLDPGHGGKDPGAISRTGKYEKNVTLAMAKETRDLLEAAGFRVKLTRTGDTYIPLRKRYKIAHEADAYLFISIHADSAKNSSAQGLSVYSLSETATDKEAAALAERENKADILTEMDLNTLDERIDPKIFIDLSQIDTNNQSYLFADYVAQNMAKEIKLTKNPHKQAGFAVLKSPSIPAVLVELGYLSNSKEDKLLQQTTYRRKIAKSLLNAVKEYFANQKDTFY